MSIKKNYDQDTFRNVIDIGLRMYGNGYSYPSVTVDYITEYCRQQLRYYFNQHHQLVKTSSGNKRLSYISTLIYSSRHKKCRLKRLEQFVQAKDRSTIQQDELVDNIVNDKKITIADRFKQICHQTQIYVSDNEDKVSQ